MKQGNLQPGEIDQNGPERFVVTDEPRHAHHMISRPSFLVEKPIGLGDTIKRVTSAEAAGEPCEQPAGHHMLERPPARNAADQLVMFDIDEFAGSVPHGVRRARGVVCGHGGMNLHPYGTARRERRTKQRASRT
jgi:hypothetical protein